VRTVLRVEGRRCRTTALEMVPAFALTPDNVTVPWYIEASIAEIEAVPLAERTAADGELLRFYAAHADLVRSGFFRDFADADGGFAVYTRDARLAEGTAYTQDGRLVGGAGRAIFRSRELREAYAQHPDAYIASFGRASNVMNGVTALELGVPTG
jgi:hypothetical protein